MRVRAIDRADMNAEQNQGSNLDAHGWSPLRLTNLRHIPHTHTYTHTHTLEGTHTRSNTSTTTRTALTTYEKLCTSIVPPPP